VSRRWFWVVVATVLAVIVLAGAAVLTQAKGMR
jgi:hypothetical protein